MKRAINNLWNRIKRAAEWVLPYILITAFFGAIIFMFIQQNKEQSTDDSSTIFEDKLKEVVEERHQELNKQKTRQLQIVPPQILCSIV